METGELEHFTDLLDNSAFVDRAGHGHSSTPPKVQEPLVPQDAEGAEHGVGVHPEYGCEVLGRGETLSGRGFAGGDGVPYLGGYLVVQGDSFGAIDLDMQHGAIHSSTMSRATDLDDAPPVEVLIPEARQHQKRRYRRSAVIVSVVALLVGALVAAALIATTSSGRGTSSPAATPLAVAAGRSTVLIRPVLCFAPPYAASAPVITGSVPACASPYDLSASGLDVTPSKAAPAGFTSNNVAPDPALAGYPNSTTDSANQVVLTSGSNQVRGGRYLLGPSELRLSAANAESVVAQRGRVGQWIVTVHLTSAASSVWDRVAQENFHQMIAIDLNGKVVIAPLMQPLRASFTSFDGAMGIGPLGASTARSLAAAIRG